MSVFALFQNRAHSDMQKYVSVQTKFLRGYLEFFKQILRALRVFEGL